MLKLKSKIALVAGASRGIGLAIAKCLAEEGARTILASRSIDQLEAQAKALREEGLSAAAVHLDFTSSESIRKCADTIGTVDILVNVAGTNIRKPFEQYTRADYDFIMQTNLHGIFELTQKVGAKMQAKGGKIINIGSLMSNQGTSVRSRLWNEQRRHRNDDEVAGCGVGQVQHTSELHCTRFYSDGHEPQDVGIARDGAVAARGAGESPHGLRGRHCTAGGFSRGQRCGLHHRADYFRGWRVFNYCCMAFSTLILFALLAQDFICPMDPDIHSKVPGKCSRCGMPLEARIIEPVEYPTTFTFHAPHLSIDVKNPKTGKPVMDFEVVHEKLMHLFVVSSDLSYFAHIHPENGKIDLDLPKPGTYKLAADFYPRGGTPQFIEHYLTTPGFDTRRCVRSLALLTPDLAPKAGENLKVSLTMEPPEPIPGKKTLLFFKLEPGDGLEQYLGAWAHALVASDDLIDMQHTHPTYASGGAEVQFDFYFPRPTTYRIWVQFQRLGVVNTVVFTIPVKELK